MESIRIFINKQTDNILILSDSNIDKNKHLCECYANYGVKIGCNVAGCYLIDNSHSTFKEDLKNALIDSFEYLNESNNDFLDSLDTYKFSIENQDNLISTQKAELTKFIENFIEVETQHESVQESHTFWDGHNWKTIILSGIDNDTWEDVTEDFEILPDSKVLGEGIIDHYLTIREIETNEEIELSVSRFADDYSYSIVTESLL